jgi:nucleoside-diphosphate-sugar epimerase
MKKRFQKNYCLISGTSSGIGKYLSKQLPFAEKYDRSSPISKYQNKEFDVIIHCAFDGSSLLGHKNLFEQLRSNISLVQDLCSLNHKIFIFFSSIDVYPKKINLKSPDYKLGYGDLFSRQAFFKIMGESIVASKAKNFLILRPSLMIGEYARANTFVNIIRGKEGPFTLSKNSMFNLITHDQVWFCLQAAFFKEIRGVMNLCSGLYVSLDEVARKVKNNNISWGDYDYQTPKIEDSNTIKLFGGTDYKIEDIISKVLSWR